MSDLLHVVELISVNDPDVGYYLFESMDAPAPAIGEEVWLAPDIRWTLPSRVLVTEQVDEHIFRAIDMEEAPGAE